MMRFEFERARRRACLSRVCAAALLLLPSLPMPAFAAVRPGADRLPRSAFDVTPPSDRVKGTRGHMAFSQTNCRVLPMADVRRRIVNVATQEWGFFSYQVVDMAFVEEREVPRGIVPDELNPKFPKPRIERQALRVGIFQDTPGVDATIGGYWSATPSGKGILAAQNAAWNQGGDAINWVQPWSAAFISWVMCESGLGNPKQFQRSAAHRDYIDQAIRAHDGKHPDAVYVAYDAGEQPITPGDMLCNARGTKDYRTLADRRRDIGAGAAVHCDIVVKVTPKHIFTIGGNVLKSVSLTILPVTKRKGAYERPVAKDDMEGANTVFAHLKLHAPPIEANALDNAPTIQALRGKVTAAAAAHAAKPKSAAH